jgi:acetolactate synthase-1/3 small subunit
MKSNSKYKKKKESNSEIVTVSRDFFVISKGRRSDIEELYNKLNRNHAVCAFRKNIRFQRKKMEISTLLEELNK